MELEHAELLRLLHYDPLTGIFTWREHRGGKARAGTKAGSMMRDGYRCVVVHWKHYAEHRLAWFYMTGKWEFELDHEDRNRSNNVFSNLRPCTRMQNMWNRTKRKGVTSRYMGVSWHKGNELWHAQIKVRGKSHDLGYFAIEEEATLAYQQAKSRFHEGFCTKTQTAQA